MMFLTTVCLPMAENLSHKKNASTYPCPSLRSTWLVSKSCNTNKSKSVVDTIFTVLSTCRNDFVLLPPFPWLYSANEWHNYEIQRVLTVDYLVPVARFALNRTFSRLWSMKWTCCVVTDSVSQFHYFLSILQSSCSVNLVPDLNCSNQSVIYYYLNIRVCQGTWCHWWSRKWYIIAWLTQTIYSFIFYL